MAARFYPGCHTGFQILIDMRAKVRQGLGIKKDGRHFDAYMAYGKYGDDHSQCGAGHCGGGCHCQYGTR